MAQVDPAEWLSGFENVRGTLESLLNEVRDSDKPEGLGQRERLRIGKRADKCKDDISRLERTLAKMETDPVAYKIAEGELSRRRGDLAMAKNQAKQLDGLLSRSENNARKQLLKNADDTEETKGQTNSELLQSQMRKQERQEDQLDGILTGVSKLKNMTYDIHNELDLQTGLLTDLDNAVQNTDKKIVTNTARVDDIREREAGGWCALCAMFLLFALMVALVVDNWACHIFAPSRC